MSTLPPNQTLPAHAGPLVTFGTSEAPKQFVLPPMSIKIRKMEASARQALQEGATDIDEESVMFQVVLLTLQRSYPTLTLEQLEEMASPAQVTDAFLTLREEEARLMYALGERAATGLLAPVAQQPQTS